MGRRKVEGLNSCEGKRRQWEDWGSGRVGRSRRGRGGGLGGAGVGLGGGRRKHAEGQEEEKYVDGFFYHVPKHEAFSDHWSP